MKTFIFQLPKGHVFLSAILLIGMTMIISCQQESRGFILPEGDVSVGKQLFTAMYCTDCHSISDVAWTGVAYKDYPNVKLGGEVTKLKSYGELVTSVINPSHKLSQRNVTDQLLSTPEGASKMEVRCYNDVMTVQQLIDIVAFLQAEYKLVVPRDPYLYH